MPERARAPLRRGDDNATVARSEVDDVVLRRHAGHVEHLVDQLGRRRQIHDILAVLADDDLRARVSGIGGDRRQEHDQQPPNHLRPSRLRQQRHSPSVPI